MPPDLKDSTSILEMLQMGEVTPSHLVDALSERFRERYPNLNNASHSYTISDPLREVRHRLDAMVVSGADSSATEEMIGVGPSNDQTAPIDILRTFTRTVRNLVREQAQGGDTQGEETDTARRSAVHVSNELIVSGDVLALDESLARLEQEYPQTGETLELALFAACTPAEIAVVHAISSDEAARDLRFGLAWLRDLLESGLAG